MFRPQFSGTKYFEDYIKTIICVGANFTMQIFLQNTDKADLYFLLMLSPIEVLIIFLFNIVKNKCLWLLCACLAVGPEKVINILGLTIQIHDQFES